MKRWWSRRAGKPAGPDDIGMPDAGPEHQAGGSASAGVPVPVSPPPAGVSAQDWARLQAQNGGGWGVVKHTVVWHPWMVLSTSSGLVSALVLGHPVVGAVLTRGR